MRSMGKRKEVADERDLKRRKKIRRGRENTQGRGSERRRGRRSSTKTRNNRNKWEGGSTERKSTRKKWSRKQVGRRGGGGGLRAEWVQESKVGKKRRSCNMSKRKTGRRKARERKAKGDEGS